MRSSFSPAVGCAAVLAASLFTNTVSAGTIRHDRDDSLYTGLSADPRYQSAGQLGAFRADGSLIHTCSGTLIASSWVLTNGHCISDPDIASIKFRFGSGSEPWATYDAARWIAHPRWDHGQSVFEAGDIGLLELSAAVSGVAPAVRYTGQDIVGIEATLVGYGRTGTGHTGSTLSSGTRRAGNNVLDGYGHQVLYGPFAEELVFADFDDPGGDGAWWNNWMGSNVPLDLEYQSAPGDSGGSWFIDVDGTTYLAAVNKGTAANDFNVDSDYDDASIAERLWFYNDWIDSYVTVPEPAGLAGFALAAAALGRRSRRR